MPLELNDKNEIKEMLEENLKLTQEIHEMTKKIKHFITFQKVMSFIYFIIIVVPIVLSIIYLPPLIKSFMEQYQNLLGGSTNFSVESLLKTGVNQVDLKNLPPEIEKLLLKDAANVSGLKDKK